MSLRQKLTVAASGASMIGLLAACEPVEPPSSYASVNNGQFQRTEPRNLPGDTTITYRTREKFTTATGKQVTITENSVYSNKEKNRDSGMDILNDNMRNVQRTVRTVDGIFKTFKGFGG